MNAERTLSAKSSTDQVLGSLMCRGTDDGDAELGGQDRKPGQQTQKLAQFGRQGDQKPGQQTQK
jgi:hypothetical protein